MYIRAEEFIEILLKSHYGQVQYPSLRYAALLFSLVFVFVFVSA